MTRQERIEARMKFAANVLNNCIDANDGKQQLNEYCRRHEIGCCRRGENCDACPITKGFEKLDDMFGVMKSAKVNVTINGNVTIKVAGNVTIK